MPLKHWRGLDASDLTVPEAIRYPTFDGRDRRVESYAIERTAINKAALGSYTNYYRPIIGIEEMQDNSGGTNDGTFSSR